MIDLPVGWEIIESVEPVYNIPDFELIIRCATREIAEESALHFLNCDKNKEIVQKVRERANDWDKDYRITRTELKEILGENPEGAKEYNDI